MPGRIVTTAILLLVACLGAALTAFGGWIAWRGVALYAWDPVLMGTGGGLAAGGLGVVALVQAARAQVATARHTARMVELLEAGGGREPPEPARRPPALSGERRPGEGVP